MSQQPLLTKAAKRSWSWSWFAAPRKRPADPSLAYEVVHVPAEVLVSDDAKAAYVECTALVPAAELELEPGLELGLELVENGSLEQRPLQPKPFPSPSMQRSAYPCLTLHSTPYVPSHQAGMELPHYHQHRTHSIGYAHSSTIRSGVAGKHRSWSS